MDRRRPTPRPSARRWFTTSGWLLLGPYRPSSTPFALVGTAVVIPFEVGAIGPISGIGVRTLFQRFAVALGTHPS